MKARVGALLVILGCLGMLVIGYLLCSERAKPAMDELLQGTFNTLGAGIAACLLANVVGALLLAGGTGAGHETRDGVVLSGRPIWATTLLVMAVLVPVSLAAWFSLLCGIV